MTTTTATKKALAVLVSGAALFLTLGAGCQGEGDDGDDGNPGVNQQDDGGDDQDGDDEGDGDGDN